MSDRVLRRDGATWTDAFLARLPSGPIWPRDTASPLYRTVRGLMGVVERWSDRALQWALLEAFPPTSSLLLPDWERVLGLPEPCFPVAQTIQERRAAVREKLQRRPGAQSRAYFIEIARRLGYHVVGSFDGLPLELPAGATGDRRVTIREYRPFMAGLSRCGDATWSTMAQRNRFYWTVRIAEARATWFRAGAGGGRSGVDPLVRVRRADDLECVLNRLKPGHTIVLFDYRGI